MKGDEGVEEEVMALINGDPVRNGAGAVEDGDAHRIADDDASNLVFGGDGKARCRDGLVDGRAVRKAKQVRN